MKYNFCPECAQPLTKKDDTHYICSNGHSVYNNPKAATGIIFKRDNKYLFAIRGQEPQKNKLDVVGGFVDYNESALDAALREVKEETGLIVTPGDLNLLGVFTSIYEQGTSTICLLYECAKWLGEPIAADDVSGFSWEDPEVILSDRFAWKSPDLENILAIIQQGR